MDPFSYLSVLTSIIVALGITRLLTGFGRLLQSRGKVQIYWIHLLWMFNVFLFLVLNWWILFRWNSPPQWTFLFLFVLLSPTIAYLLTVLLVPEPFEEGLDLKQHFFGNHRWFFVLAALLPFIDSVDTLLKGWTHFLAQGWLYVITILLLFGLSVIAARSRWESFHAFFSYLFSYLSSCFHCYQSTCARIAIGIITSLGQVAGAGEKKLGKFLASQDTESSE